jgi:hypothetical protein
MRDSPRLAALVEDSGPDAAPVHLTDSLVRVARAGWPRAGSGHRRLPALLVGLTVVTGLVDAVSYLALGHVFVANMTGNIVFLGFALAGAPGLSAPASLAALARSCSEHSPAVASPSGTASTAVGTCRPRRQSQRCS